MAEATGPQLVPVAIEDEMRQAYLDYSMSVIVGRALPDVRDGLKPVHRRILYAMFEQGMLHNKRYSKSAGTVGEVLKKYHPHGDASVYDALVRLAQDWNMRAPLVDGQGNFGSIDGDAAAAYRYTEARLTRLAEFMLADIDKETVDFGPNFDDSTTEPLVLPSRFPNLLVNGSAGIAVGMATNIPPHNLGEVIESCVHLIDNPEAPLSQLRTRSSAARCPAASRGLPHRRHPHGRLAHPRALRGAAGASSRSARGWKSRWRRRPSASASWSTEVPYQINKARAIQSIADLVKDKKLEGISDLRDESSREGIRAVIETKRDAIAGVVLNNLYQHSSLFQDSFGATMLSIDRGQPRTLALKAILERFIAHRRDVVMRRTRYELRKAKEREHILLGYKIALDHIDEIIALIKASASRDEASQKLQTLLRALRDPGQGDSGDAAAAPHRPGEGEDPRRAGGGAGADHALSAILSSEQLLLGVIKDELREVQKLFGDPRRTEIQGEASDLSDEDLIAEEDMVVTFSHQGYVKRNPVSLYRAQRRGGRGKAGAGTTDEDFIEQIFVASTHAYVLIFTSKGRLFWLKVHELPQAGRAARGKAIVNLVPLQQDEKIAALLPVKELKATRKGDDDAPEEEAPAAEEAAAPAGEGEEVEESEAARVASKALQVAQGPYIVFVTQNGLVKRTKLVAFARPRPSGLKALSIEESDSLVAVMLAKGDEDILIGTSQGMAIRFDQKEARAMGRTAFGVKGITLESGDRVVGAELSPRRRHALHHHRERVRQAHRHRRVPAHPPRRQGRDRHQDRRSQRQRGGHAAGHRRRSGDDHHQQGHADPEPRRGRLHHRPQHAGVRVMSLSQDGEKVVGATRAPEEREADAAAAVAADQAGNEDDDGSPPDGET